MSDQKDGNYADNRRLNPADGSNAPKPDNTHTGNKHQQDPERRLGNYQQAGEHARTGRRGQ